jgi:hypothetical protein
MKLVQNPPPCPGPPLAHTPGKPGKRDGQRQTEWWRRHSSWERSKQTRRPRWEGSVPKRRLEPVQDGVGINNKMHATLQSCRERFHLTVRSPQTPGLNLTTHFPLTAWITISQSVALFLLFLLVVLGLELRVSCLPDKCSWATCSSFFTLVIFQTGSYIFAWVFRHQSYYLCILHSWDHRCATSTMGLTWMIFFKCSKQLWGIFINKFTTYWTIPETWKMVIKCLL